MRISRIKLAGFKSFVDPTTIQLPGNLTGVVGPNGCGKSNIIDALQWVMGESSAKQLRGDSMADVIFNGSNARKPVGQASVELVFDNADGTIGGPYASFAEIAIKRTVTRDGTSSYFLNGTRCRRKDITDVFLGTGLGIRGGYSVIEQGMISRVIEAKPEELRNYLEEAAGISRYKERRRETETRIRHTNENLERVNDIRQELEKQLERLQRQAKAAEKYQELKAQERQLEAQAIAIRWQAIDGEHQSLRGVMQARETEVEAALAELRRFENDLVELREGQGTVQAEFNQCQSEFYAHGAEISRLEQTLRHNEERRQALEDEQARVRQSQVEATRMLGADQARLEGIDREMAVRLPVIEQAAAMEEQHALALRRAEQAAEQWQQSWDQFNQTFTAVSRAEHAAQARLEVLARGANDVVRRLEALCGERGQIDASALEIELSAAREVLARATDELAAQQSAQQHARETVASARDQVRTNGQQLHLKRGALQEAKGRLASLQALQEAALGRDQRQLLTWLEGQGLGGARPLAESIRAEAGWEFAVEVALGQRLAALCGPGFESRLAQAPAGSAPTASVIALGNSAVRSAFRADAPLERLLDKLSSPLPLESLLGGVFVASGRSEAEAARAELLPHESIVLPDGTWLGPNWLQLPGVRQAQDSVLVRESRLAAMRSEEAALAAEAIALEEAQREAQAAVQAEEQREAGLAAQINAKLSERGEARSRVQSLESQVGQMQARAAELGRQAQELESRAADGERELAALREEASRLHAQLEALGEEREVLNQQRREVQSGLDQAREIWRVARDERHGVALQLEGLKSSRSSLEHAIERNRRLSEEQTARLAALDQSLAATLEPQQGLREGLEAALARRMQSEQALKAAREKLDQVEQRLRTGDENRLRSEREAGERQRALEQVRLDERALQVRAQEQEARLRQTGQALAEVLAGLPADATEESWQDQLATLAARIARLGPINLAAIDEFSQLGERKTYLDAQYADLTEALGTLEEAMRKIDRETRTRFKETFDQVNAGLQRLFPVLVGGGHAYLELTGDDLLETGVTVMARPPGKRNSTIHLLSGGEKALAALAFVFALFELNAAPFCLLDEVDAPLDDANVVRLSTMLRQMSARVQFLFISHNKITMEIAEQLIGVTMNEPGVSRLVSVNMDEAVQLAGAAA